MSKKIIIVVGLIVSLGALWWALHDIQFDQVGVALQHIEWGWLLLAVPPWAFTFWAKVARWRLLYYPDERKADQGHLLAALMIGYLFNTILPFRTGELVRATVMRLTQGWPIARTLSTILVEKVLDTMTLVLGLGLILPFIELPADFRGPALTAAVLFSALFIAVLAGAIWPQAARRLLAALLRPVPPGVAVRITSIADSVLDGLIPLRQRAVAPRIAFWSLCAWVFNVVSVYLILVSFGLLLPPSASMLTVIATNLIMAVPSAPGYVGIYHATAKQALLVFLPQQESLALAVAVVLHAFGFLPLAVAGAIALLREGMSFSSLRATAEPLADPSLPVPVRPQ